MNIHGPGTGKGRDSAVTHDLAFRPRRVGDPGTAEDWARRFGEMKRTIANWGPVVDWPVYDRPCELVLTGAGGRPNVLNVRCRCMAGTVGPPPRRFYNYDVIGTTGDLAEAVQMWKDHCAERAAR